MIKKINGAKTTTYTHDQDIMEVDGKIITFLKKAAKKDVFGRARLCLHKYHDDLVQEMLIVIRKDSYVRPHKHIGKSESFYIIEGSIKVLFFDDNGSIVRTIELSKGDKGKPFGYRLSKDLWHSVVLMTPYAVILEVTTGPFDSTRSVFAPWSPDETDNKGIQRFMRAHKISPS